MGKIKTKVKSNFYVQYTIIFCVLFVCCFFWFYAYKRSFFRTADGLDQHYLIFLYIGKWIREVVSNIFVHHTFSIPMWDMSMGYGSDIFPTLGMYFPDPFNWISALFPSRYAEMGFNISLVLKFYLTGIAFSYYGFHKKYDKNTVLVGSILYTFCGTMYIAFVEAPFINPMYIFPFLIVGIDKIFDKKSPKTYILALGVAFINYFYFAYMMCIFAVGYCLLYYFTKYTEKRSIRDFLSIVLKFVGYSLISLGISMVVLLPILGVLVGQGRLKTGYFLPTLYGADYYKSIYLGFVRAYCMSGRDAIVGFGAITLFAIGRLFQQKGRFRNEKLQFILLTIILCIPALGSAMNGFSYYANRWVWAYSLCVVNIACLMLPEYKNAKKDDYRKLGVFLVLYFAVAYYFVRDYNPLLLSTIILVCVMYLFFWKANTYTDKVFHRGAVIFSMVCVVLQAFYWFGGDGGEIDDEVKFGIALNTIMNGNGGPALSDISRSEGVRVDTNGVAMQVNANWISKIYGSDLYISLYNNDVVKFHNSLALNVSSMPQRIYGLDRRSELNLLMGTKYYLVPEKFEGLLPIGYTELERTEKVYGKAISRYSNPDSVSMILGYSDAVNSEVYENLQPFERQQLLMKACVIKESDNMKMPELIKDEINYAIETSKDICDNLDGTYTVKEPNSELRLIIPKTSDSELYVYFEGIELVQNEHNMVQSFRIRVKALNSKEEIPYTYNLFDVSTNRTHMSAGKDDWMVNLGCLEEEADTIVVHFDQEGTYKIESLHIYAQSVTEIKEALHNMRRVTDSVEIGTNSIKANLHIEDSKYVYISVPYSSGWKAKLNGEEVDVIKANGAFMAIKVQPGNYILEMTFVTPFLFYGLLISVCSVVVLVAIERNRKRK